ncbi:hypothetical protein H2198_003663 [Neophaeococcomyces mojaviensis]|uniref:Uncharacterized protein n=1 Tax=Neophaeococcomyces mojaviensis TaxID=3383035 RepID=A0ACC3AAT3_9EURO|nr:hypothetical protein H2198_003663 [Knufia sp. JES_112]
MATKQLATWACSLEFSSVPRAVVDAAVRSFQNSLGCIVGGSTHPTVQQAIEALKPTFGDAKHTIFGQSTKNASALLTDASNAALINGIASHVHDFDDTHLHTVIHPAGAVVVALLACSESEKARGRSVSGKDFITALVAGIEIGLRVGNAVSPNHYSEGWHITGTVSPIAVAAALSNLLHLQPDKATNALGIASTQPVGIRVHFGTDTKAFHAGRAAQNGMLAAQLAQGGFTAASDALEGRRGWVEVLGNNSNSLDEQLEQLATFSKQDQSNLNRERWEIEKNTFKPFPCGIVIHPTIDACIQLHNTHNLSDRTNIERIKTIHLKVHPLVFDLTGKKTPKNGLEAKFSVYHGAAIGLVLGSATPAEYEDHIVNDPHVLNIRGKVVAEVDERMQSDEAVVKLTMSEGSEIEKPVQHAVGSLAHPMTNEQLEAKFLKQVAPVIGQSQAEGLDRLAWKILELEDISVITEAGK